MKMMRFFVALLSCLLLFGCAAPTVEHVPESQSTEPTFTEETSTTEPETTATVVEETVPPTTESVPTEAETLPEPDIPWYETSRLIYHAGGAIDGLTYTNSKEAIEKTLADGNMLLEIDFLFTSDGHLVCLHEWQNLQGLSGPVTLERFLSLKMYYTYTTITAGDVIAYMRQYPDMYLIVDTKEASAVAVVAELLRLCDDDPEVADRFVVQLYDGGMKEQVLELYPFGQDNFLFTAYKFGPYRIEDIRNLCVEEEIRIITLPYGSWDKATVEQFYADGFLIFEHTVNYTSMTDNALSRGVYGFYTDSLQESDLGLEN